jgi:hypothetical protein
VTKSKKDAPDPMDELLDRLLGPVTEMSDDEIDAVLGAAGIDVVSARNALYAKVSGMRSDLWQKNVEVPSQMVTLLDQLRPHGLPTSDPKTARRAAGTWVRDLLAKRPSEKSDFAFAARGRDGDLSDNDDKLRQELEEELASSIDQETDE